MEIKASRVLKIVYCLVLLGSFFITWHMASSSWIGLATGLAFRGGMLLQTTRLVIFLIFALRIISVIFNPKALDVYATGILSKGIRILGIFLMWVGLAAIIAMLFIKPITMIVFYGSGEYAVGAFAVGMYLVLIAPIGFIGVIVFEIIRLRGVYIRTNRSKMPASETSLPEETEKRKMPLLEKLSILLTILIALIFIIDSQKERFMGNVFFSENTKRIKTLVNIGYDVNKRNISGYSLLHHAASRGDKELVELLIAKGANVNTKDQWGATPLHCISEGFHNEDDEALQTRLRKEGVHGLECRFGTKDEEAKLRVAEVLISHGADVNSKASQSGTPLHKAAYFNKLQMAKLLIAHGANVTSVDSFFGTPLHATGMHGNCTDMAKLLVENGANIDALDKHDYTPLHIASEYGNKEIVKFLLSKKANVNARNKNDDTPLHLASGHVDRHDLNNKEVVEILLANGADINAKDKYDFTALHKAVAYGSPNTVEVLLTNHADVNAKSKGKYGKTPFQWVVEKAEDSHDPKDIARYKQVKALLLSHGAN